LKIIHGQLATFLNSATSR